MYKIKNNRHIFTLSQKKILKIKKKLHNSTGFCSIKLTVSKGKQIMFTFVENSGEWILRQTKFLQYRFGNYITIAVFACYIFISQLLGLGKTTCSNTRLPEQPISVQICRLNSNNELQFKVETSSVLKVETSSALKSGIKDMSQLILSLRAGDFPPKANGFKPGYSKKPMSRHGLPRVNKFTGTGQGLFGQSAPNPGTVGAGAPSCPTGNGPKGPPGTHSQIGRAATGLSTKRSMEASWPYEKVKAHSYFNTKTKLLDVKKFKEEIARQAKEVGNLNYTISDERIKHLASELGVTDLVTTREAMAIIKGEILGLWQNAQRTDYGSLKGPDFTVTGVGEFKNITHVDVKNPVGSKILANTKQTKTVRQQGADIGKKAMRQKKLWTNETKYTGLTLYDPNLIKSPLPKTMDNMQTVVCLDDIPASEHANLMIGLNKTALDYVIF